MLGCHAEWGWQQSTNIDWGDINKQPKTLPGPPGQGRWVWEPHHELSHKNNRVCAVDRLQEKNDRLEVVHLHT